ncbi:VENN motif pre-toxin domain-containing protein, partial [Pantoea vagans]
QNRQIQDVSALSRDTEHANDSISAIFDKEKEQKRLQTAQLAGEISGQMTNIVTTMGDIKGLEKAQSAKNAGTLPAGATEKKRGEWLEKMRDSPEYQAEMKQWGIGSTSQKVAQTVGSILTGLVTGNAGQAVAGGLNPWAAQLIKKETTDASGNVDVATNAMAHAVWGAVSSQMSGGSAAAGAAGAFSGELATRYIAEKYWGADTPEKIAALGQEDREQLSLLGTLAAGLAGGMAGNSSAAATSGAVAGKNAVENNSLADIAQAQSEGKTLEQKAGEYVEAENERYKEANCGGMSVEACSVKMYTERREALKDMALTGTDFVPVVSTIKGAAEAQSALDYLSVAASLIPGERVAAGVLKAAEKALVKGDVAEASKLLNKASDEISTAIRPGHRQSEIDVGKDLGDGWREQVSFKDGKEVPYGTKGGVRPDWCQGNVCSVEVKNYNITTNQSGLINNVSKQALQRAENLPAGMRQEVVIDIRGQKVTSIQEDAIIKGIVQKSNGVIKPTDIQFKR